MYKTKKSLILASASPRRRELLSRVGLNFNIVHSDVEEVEGEIEGSPQAITQEWARRKAESVAERVGEPDACYLGVDTVVVVGDEIIGKPASAEQAREFLARLSGRWHEVASGYCLWRPAEKTMVRNVVISEVKIKSLAEAEIRAYADTDEPLDKAGAYAVQGIGAFMVQQIKGSYTNVVGLPLTEVLEDLEKLGVIGIG